MAKPPLKKPREIETGADLRTGKLLGFLLGPGLMMLILSALGLHLWINGHPAEPDSAKTRFYYSAER